MDLWNAGAEALAAIVLKGRKPPRAALESEMRAAKERRRYQKHGPRGPWW